MEQELKSSEQVTSANAEEIKKTGEVKPTVTNDVQKTESKKEEVVPDAEKLAKETNSESYQLRKKREVDDLKRQLVEKDRLLQDLAKNPPKVGEAFDPLLGRNLPQNLSAIEYRELLLADMQKKQEQAVVSHIRQQADAVKEKHQDADILLRNAAITGLVNENIVIAAGNTKGGDGIEFLYHLIKENPDALKEVTSLANPFEQAVTFGELLAKYRNKPAPRSASADIPPNVVNDVGTTSGADINSLPKDQQFRTRLAQFRARHKR